MDESNCCSSNGKCSGKKGESNPHVCNCAHGDGSYDYSNDGYNEFLPGIQRRFDRITNTYGPHAFTTNVTGLFPLFLAGLPEEARQHYNCKSCARFMDKFGSLMVISSRGIPVPLFWNHEDAPDFFRTAILNVRTAFQRAEITGIFYHKGSLWGRSFTKAWHHMHVQVPTSAVFISETISIKQKVSETKEIFKIVKEAMESYDLLTIRTMASFLINGKFCSSKELMHTAKWLMDLKKRRHMLSVPEYKINLIWLFVAQTTIPRLHRIQKGIIKTLLEDFKLAFYSK